MGTEWRYLMLENFLFSIGTTLPIFNIMVIGYLLKRNDIIDDNFIKKANFIVFNFALPIKLFNDVYKTDIQAYFDLKFVIFIVSGAIASAGLAWVLGAFLLKDKFQLGAFVQGSFRGNFVYIGLSLMENITGSIGLKAPLVIAFVIPLYNILSVIILSYTNTDQREKINIKHMVKKVMTNPLIIAVILGILAAQIKMPIPVIALRTMGYFEAIATPLALLGIGGAFSFGSLGKTYKTSLLASSLKLIIIPLIMVGLGLLIGLNNEDILLTYILFGAPTAVSSYIMTAAMKGDKDLASSIIMSTTILANITMTLFIFVFKSVGVI